jgi:uncharacterized protein (TIGR02145 family)
MSKTYLSGRAAALSPGGHFIARSAFILLLWCCPALLAAQNGMTVSNFVVSAGSPTTVTFDVSWNKSTMPVAPWSDTAWVFVDYNDNGVMKRLPLSPGATLTATSASGAGKVIAVPGNNQGVWVVGNARDAGTFTATVRLLAAVANVAGACAYASNYPPVGEYISPETVKFTGTPPYDLTLSTGTDHAYGNYNLLAGQTLESFMDNTGAPGMIKCIEPATYTLSGSNVCVGSNVNLTLSGSQGGGWRYQLYKGDTPVGGVVDGTGLSLTFNEVTATAATFNYTVRTTVDATGVRCAMQVSNELGITVNPLPTNLTLTAAPAAICTGQSSTLTASATNGASYSINNSTWQTAKTFKVTPSSNASYTLYVKTSAGCSATKNNATTVKVNTVPNITKQPASTITCTGTMVQLSVVASNATGYQWKMNGANVTNGGTSANYTTTPLSNSSTYTVMIGNTACTVTSSAAVITTRTAPGSTTNFTAFDPCPEAATGTLWYLTDTRDAKTYKVVKMPDGRIWFAQNLNYTQDLHYNTTSNMANDQPLPGTDAALAIGSYWCPPRYDGVTPAATVSGNEAACNTYGALYTWETAMMVDGKYADETKMSSMWSESWVLPNYFDTGTPGATANADKNNARGGTAMKGGGRGICPMGWYIPTEYEWAYLLDKVDGTGADTAYSTQTAAGWAGTDAGQKLKSAATYSGTTDVGVGSWRNNDAANGTNTFDFSILPAGYRHANGVQFYRRGLEALYWSSTVYSDASVWRRSFDYTSTRVSRSTAGREHAFSVRCVKD